MYIIMHTYWNAILTHTGTDTEKDYGPYSS